MRRASSPSTSASGMPRACSTHEQVVDEVGRLGDDTTAVLGDSGDGDLDRLFTELLGAVRHAFVDERSRV